MGIVADEGQGKVVVLTAAATRTAAFWLICCALRCCPVASCTRATAPAAPYDGSDMVVHEATALSAMCGMIGRRC
jgi:hypothetical protein